MRSDRGHEGATVRREGVWPRVYRPTRGYRLFLGGFGSLAIAGGIAGVVFTLRDPSAPPTAGAVAGAAFILFGAFLLGALARERVLLFEDGSAEFRELGRGRTRLRREEIREIRTFTQRGIRYVFFHFREQGRKPFKTALICERDAHFDRWLAAFPDLGASEVATAAAERDADAVLGRDSPGRRRTLSRARVPTRILTGLTWAAVAWGWFHPRPYAPTVAALAALPLLALALVLVGRGAIALDERKGDPRPGVATALTMPGFVLSLRALLDLQLIDQARLLGWATVVATAMAGVVAALDPTLRRRLPAVAAFGLLAFPWAWGALAEANVLLDGGEPTSFRAAVLERRIDTSQLIRHELRLAPWGPMTDPDAVYVGRQVWDALSVGDEACVRLRGGALGARWFDVRPCD